MTSFQQHSLKIVGTVLAYLRRALDSALSNNKNLNCQWKLPQYIMFLIRLSWLIRFDGMLSESFFTPNKLHLYPRRVKVSVEQLFSAFEIADADGDGKLTAPEVIEVTNLSYANWNF